MAGTCGTSLTGGRRRSRKMKGGDGSCGMPGGRRRRSRRGGGPPETESECAAAGGTWRDGECLPNPPSMGGRRRRRTMKGGMGVGFQGALDGGTSGPAWGPAWGGEVTKSGEPVFEPDARPPVTGGRRRKSKKSKKGGKRRRTMRGGASWQTIAPAGGSFTGEGERGLANVAGYASKVPPASGGPSQNPDGAYHV